MLTCVASEVAKAAAALIEHGRKGDAHVSVTVGGTTTEQRTVVSTLNAVEADASDLVGEAVVVVGDVVKKADKLGWFEQRALYGWRVLVPRTRDQAGALSSAAAGLRRDPGRGADHRGRAAAHPGADGAGHQGPGHRPLPLGRVHVAPTRSRPSARSSRSSGWTPARSPASRSPPSATPPPQALVDFGIKPELVPSGGAESEGLLKDWAPYDDVFDPIDRVFLPRADIATDTLVAGLKELGWAVDDVTAYRTVRAAPPPAETREALKGGGFDAVLFTSSSTVRNLVGIAGKPHDTTVLAAIGPQTKATAEELGLRVDVLAAKPDVASLVEGLAAYALELRAAGELPPAAKRRKGMKKASARTRR